ncbi:MAG: hypothetical protein N2327_05810 [Caldimicrobium sp.]|nr:hypothetical protein [Caldimicrobium sp.]MCX7873926.1 hypothetical protein [Caldimicrobium sp.]MDW8094281.1 hypothetical protein [Caldimicrobium sp.]
MKPKWVDHLAKAWDAFFEDLFSFIPEESRKHLRNARKEVLLAMKTALEKRIEELEKEEKQEVKKIQVERS